jgi:hypothetical protein
MPTLPEELAPRVSVRQLFRAEGGLYPGHIPCGGRLVPWPRSGRAGLQTAPRWQRAAEPRQDGSVQQNRAKMAACCRPRQDGSGQQNRAKMAACSRTAPGWQRAADRAKMAACSRTAPRGSGFKLAICVAVFSSSRCKNYSTAGKSWLNTAV